MIKVERLVKRYREAEALKGISFEVDRGEIIGLVGPNGAGKTTTMKILTGYMMPTEGAATVAGHDVIRRPLKAQRHLGYLPETVPVYTDMLVQDYLKYIAALRGVSPFKVRSRVSEVVRLCNIEDRLAWPIGHLSKGYRQRVGIAQAIVHDPDVVILDEPTSGLDPNQIFHIRALIQHLGENKTVIVSTHILSEVEASCSRAIILIDGRVRADRDLEDLRGRNEAIVSLENAPPDAADALRQAEGVETIVLEPSANGLATYRVSGQGELTPSLYRVVKERDFALVELRRAERRLEDVFRELTSQRAEVGFDAVGANDGGSAA